jgi:hypothetical protein
MPDPNREFSIYRTSRLPPLMTFDFQVVANDTARDAFVNRAYSMVHNDTPEPTAGAGGPNYGNGTNWYVPSDTGGYTTT